MTEANLSDYLVNPTSRQRWSKIGMQKRSGVVASLFSLYSSDSLGIGDFSDLKLLVDWAQSSGNSIIQLLPLNEMGAGFCPYDSLSSFALEPACISFSLLPEADKKIISEDILEVRQLFPAGKPYLDFRIKEEKIHLLWEVFSKRRASAVGDLSDFKKENSYWLQDFALFKVIKQTQNGLPWYEWEEKLKNRDAFTLEGFAKSHADEINFQIWMQWLIFKQFKQVKEYAHKKKVLIKGDLPILVSRDSADVWAHPEFFKLDLASGAPPDMYCAKGQRWGMPTYRWDTIASDDYRYLIAKLKYAEHFYDLLRIDHVVGLFRIWSIPYNDPEENKGLNGFFDPKEESKWGVQGKSILTVMQNNTRMLLCAEDLGVIPQVCIDTLKELGIPGNDVSRWVKDWNKRHDFLLPDEYRLFSVTMLSTHDTTNFPAWWKYEAGTIDEALFMRKCHDRGIDYAVVKDRLFDKALSHYGRLRWLKCVDSADKLVVILAKPKEQVGDFIDLYLNTYLEKEKLWKILAMPGALEEDASTKLVAKALKFTLDSHSVFCIQSMIDWLYLTDIFTGDPYPYRINTPGTISDKNWSLTIPISLEDLLKHKVCGQIKKMVKDSGRA